MSKPRLELRAVDITNYHQVMKLETAAEQRRFVWSNAGVLAEAAYVPDMTPEAVYADGELVGLVSWGRHRPDFAYDQPPLPGCYAVEHVMIAHEFQRRGLGRRVIALLIARLSALPDCRRIVLSVHPDNAPSLRLYADFGFHQYGVDHENDSLLDLIV